MTYQHLVHQNCPVPEGTPVFCYARDSGGEGQNKSVKEQLEAIQEYCDKFKLRILGIYADEAKLSSNTRKRGDLNAMLKVIRDQRPTIHDLYERETIRQEHPLAMVCWNANRLTRDSEETDYIKSDLRLRAVIIMDLSGYKPTGDRGTDRIVEAVKQTHDEALLASISKDAKRGLARLVTLRDTDLEFRQYNPDWPVTDKYLGLLPGKPPTGFRGVKICIGYNARRKERHMVQRIEPDHTDGLWERCYLAWEMLLQGATYGDIHRATRLFKGVGCYSTFFRNRIYTGVLEYGDLVLEDFVPALIPSEWYDAAQGGRAERATKQHGETTRIELEPRRVAS